MPIVFPAELKHRGSVLAEFGDVVLVDVGSNVDRRHAPEHHEPLLRLAADALADAAR